MYYFESLQTTLQMFADKVQDIWLKFIFKITSDYQAILPSEFSEFLDSSTYKCNAMFVFQDSDMILGQTSIE